MDWKQSDTRQTHTHLQPRQHASRSVTIATVRPGHEGESGDNEDDFKTEATGTHPSYHVGVRVRRPDVGVFVTFWTLDQICSKEQEEVETRISEGSVRLRQEASAHAATLPGRR